MKKYYVHVPESNENLMIRAEYFVIEYDGTIRFYRSKEEGEHVFTNIVACLPTDKVIIIEN